MLGIERKLLLLCLVTIINAATLRDLLKRPSYDYRPRNYEDDDAFWGKYDNLNEKYDQQPLCQPDGKKCTVHSECSPICSTLGQGFCDLAKTKPICLPDRGSHPFRDMENGLESDSSSVGN